MENNPPQPLEIKLHQKSRKMDISFSDGSRFELSYELLRVYSPSAEVRGHGPGQEVLQVGKRDVEILSLEPSGGYAVQPTFSDGHNTGIYYLGLPLLAGPEPRKPMARNTSSASRRRARAASRVPRLSSAAESK